MFLLTFSWTSHLKHLVVIVCVFVDNGLELKLFLNEEIGRLKQVIGGSLKSEGMNRGEPVFEKTTKVLKAIDGFREKDIDSNMIEKILKIQNLASELTNNGN